MRFLWLSKKRSACRGDCDGYPKLLSVALNLADGASRALVAAPRPALFTPGFVRGVADSQPSRCAAKYIYAQFRVDQQASASAASPALRKQTSNSTVVGQPRAAIASRPAPSWGAHESNGSIK